jgi:hypothetical protein
MASSRKPSPARVGDQVVRLGRKYASEFSTRACFGFRQLPLGIPDHVDERLDALQPVADELGDFGALDARQQPSAAVRPPRAAVFRDSRAFRMTRRKWSRSASASSKVTFKDMASSLRGARSGRVRRDRGSVKSMARPGPPGRRCPDSRGAGASARRAAARAAAAAGSPARVRAPAARPRGESRQMAVQVGIEGRPLASGR